ncbi:methyltransferase domain-containing protein [Candidatus Saganbacteria bacterium]|nr:methyltransferase domain-containing protein [Candidatus Saganbacteria bacterium]
MDIVMHVRGKPDAFIREIIRGVKGRVAPKGKYLRVSGSPLTDPRLFEQTPSAFLGVFYSWAGNIKTAVELGCLDHSFLPNVPGITSLAVDQRQEGLQRVQTRYPHVAVVRANIRTLPFPDERIDLVFWNKEMIYFLGQYSREYNAYTDDLLTGATHTNADRALSDIYRIIKPGGYFVESRPMRDTWALPLRFNKIGARFKELHYVFVEGQSLPVIFFRK